MEWTGELYGFYSNKSKELVFEALKKEVEPMGYQHELYEMRSVRGLFFYKDQNMLDYHHEHGYNTDINGEGCFNIEYRQVSLDGIATLYEFEQKSDFEPYDINLVFEAIEYYVLIVPDIIEDSTFSKKIHGMFSNILRIKEVSK